MPQKRYGGLISTLLYVTLKDGFYYGRFLLFPLNKGQAHSVGIALRRTLLEDIKGTFITVVKFHQWSGSDKIKELYSFSRIKGIPDTVEDILMNFKKLIIRSFIEQPTTAVIHLSPSDHCSDLSPVCITAKDIRLPPGVEIINTDQYIFSVTEPTNLLIELKIERTESYYTENKQSLKGEGIFHLEGLSVPVQNVNYTIHECVGDKEAEMLLIEIWTNESLLPTEALSAASIKLARLYGNFMPKKQGDDKLLNDFLQGLQKLDSESSPESKIDLTYLLFSVYENEFHNSDEPPISPFEYDEEEESYYRILEILEENRRILKEALGYMIEEERTKKPRRFLWEFISLERLGFSQKTAESLQDLEIYTARDLYDEYNSGFPSVQDLGIAEVEEIGQKIVELANLYVLIHDNLPRFEQD